MHGNFLLQCHRYRNTVHNKRQIAQDLCDGFVNAVTEIYSGEDADTIIDAYKDGKKPASKPGKKSRRQQARSMLQGGQFLVYPGATCQHVRARC